MACSVADVETVLNDMLSGVSLNKSLNNRKITRYAFFNLIDNNPSLSARYVRAQQLRAELLADEVVDIADEESDPQHARNRIDVRKWYASKMQPQKYGERIDLNVNQTVDIGGALLEARQRASLPVIETPKLIEVESLVIPDPYDKSTTDSESVAPKTRDAPENEADDIFQ